MSQDENGFYPFLIAVGRHSVVDFFFKLKSIMWLFSYIWYFGGLKFVIFFQIVSVPTPSPKRALWITHTVWVSSGRNALMDFACANTEYSEMYLLGLPLSCQCIPQSRDENRFQVPTLPCRLAGFPEISIVQDSEAVSRPSKDECLDCEAVHVDCRPWYHL